MFVRIESTPDESTWQAASALTRLKETDRVRRGGQNALQHNNVMHPTRNSAALIITGSGGRVMPSVRPLTSDGRFLYLTLIAHDTLKLATA